MNLISTSALRQLDALLWGKLAEIEEQFAIDLENPVYGESFRYYLLFTHWPDMAGQVSADLSPTEVFYNRYYWFKRFVRQFTSIIGSDAGLEQQAFRLLEENADTLDWPVIEEIEETVDCEER